MLKKINNIEEEIQYIYIYIKNLAWLYKNRKEKRKGKTKREDGELTQTLWMEWFETISTPFITTKFDSYQN